MISFDLIIDASEWEQITDISSIISAAFKAGEELSGKTGEVSVLLTGDAQMHRLNKAFRGKDKPTDVLSFPADPMDSPFLGDIAIGYETSARDAEAGDKTLPDHLTHLLLHAYFHLLGYDHQNDADAEEMEAMERRALASLGIADPYSES